MCSIPVSGIHKRVGPLRFHLPAGRQGFPIDDLTRDAKRIAQKLSHKAQSKKENRNLTMGEKSINIRQLF